MKAPKPSRAPARPYLPIQEALLVNAMSASTTGAALDTLLARSINTANSTVYDRAIDSVYLSAHTGGSHLHHLLDGQHDLAGAFAAAQAVAPNDSLTHQVLGTAHHLSKDLFSVMGLPVLSLNPKTYCDSADWMQQHLGLSKAWQADLLQINGMELLGGSLAAGALIAGLGRRDRGTLAEIAGSSGLVGVLAANPIAIIAAAVALCLAWRGCSGEAKMPLRHWDRFGTGVAGAGTTLVVGSLLGSLAATGALGLAISLVLSLTAGIVVRGWLNTRPGKPSPSPTLQKANSDESWRSHVMHSSSQLRHHLDEPALKLLRSAFPRPA